jgi:hypothetical protein
MIARKEVLGPVYNERQVDKKEIGRVRRLSSGFVHYLDQMFDFHRRIPLP